MIPKIFIQHDENKSHFSIEIDCGFFMKENSDDKKEDLPFVARIHIFSGSYEQVEKVKKYLVTYWNGANETQKDAINRVNKCRFGSLSDCTPEYKERLYISVQQWANDLRKML